MSKPLAAFSLDSVRLAFECPLRWEKLARVASGQDPNRGDDDAKRFCGTCERHVHNLSAMSRPAAEAFLREVDVAVCVRVEVDAAGRAVHRPAMLPALAGVALVAGLGACNVGADSADSWADSGGGLEHTEVDLDRTHGGGSTSARGADYPVLMGEPSTPNRPTTGIPEAGVIPEVVEIPEVKPAGEVKRPILMGKPVMRPEPVIEVMGGMG